MQMGARAGAVGGARAAGRGVVAACAAPLAGALHEQLQQLGERWHGAAAALQALRARAHGAALRQVAELLDTTCANVSDRTSLAIRLSLVKVRLDRHARPARRPCPMSKLCHFRFHLDPFDETFKT